MLSPLMLRVGPSSSTNGAEDTTGAPPLVEIQVDSNPPVADSIQVQTPIGLQYVDGMVVPPTTFSPYITISEGEARGDTLTLKYWREGVDDQDGDGVADEGEYQYQTHRPSLLPIERFSEVFGLGLWRFRPPMLLGKTPKLERLEEVKVVTRFP